MVCPLIYVGTMFGVLLNKLLPEIIIIFLFCLLMGSNFYKTITKGIKLYKQEKNIQEKSPKLKLNLNQPPLINEEEQN